MSELQQIRRGWGFPGTSRKAHYFTEDGMALCRKWGFYHGPLDDTNHESNSNCAECKRRRAAAPSSGEEADRA